METLKSFENESKSRYFHCEEDVSHCHRTIDTRLSSNFLKLLRNERKISQKGKFYVTVFLCQNLIQSDFFFCFFKKESFASTRFMLSCFSLMSFLSSAVKTLLFPIASISFLFKHRLNHRQTLKLLFCISNKQINIVNASLID